MKNHKNKSVIFYLSFSFLFFLVSHLNSSQQEVTISIEKVAGDVFCLYGAGGNIGILEAKEGLLIVDSQYERIANEILGEIKKISPKKILFLINTHYHGDHVQGNSVIGKDARIISHKNCKDSYLKGKKPEELETDKGVPQETYEKEMILDLGTETVKLLHFGPGHTSGDTVVVFEKSGVIHAGDLFFYGLPPYIDVEDGSDTGNWIKTIGKLAEKYPDFQIIPGHGKITTMPEFMKFANYLRYLHNQVKTAIQAGKTKEQTIESIDLTAYSHIQDQGEFLTKKKNIEWIFDELIRK